jgi:hypothetical protein
MKNHYKDALLLAKRCMALKIIIKSSFTRGVRNEKPIKLQARRVFQDECQYYFLRYMTSFTSLTVLFTSGKAAATRLGA